MEQDSNKDPPGSWNKNRFEDQAYFAVDGIGSIHYGIPVNSFSANQNPQYYGR